MKIAFFAVVGSAESRRPRRIRDAVASRQRWPTELPGLLWRSDGAKDGDAHIASGDADEIVDLSVWENPAALQSFVNSHSAFRVPHDRIVATSPEGHTAVAWWVRSRQEPTIAEAHGRLEFLREHGSSPYAFSPREPQPQLSIDRVWLDNADVQLLIAQLNADLFSRYPEPGALIFSLDPSDIVDGVGALLLAVLDERPVGCGAFRVMDDQPGSAEIKRMYVAMSARGHKIGAALLVELERRALELGVHRFVLETGPRQPEALARYGRAGYVACEPWAEFVGKDFSICLEKTRISPETP